MVCWVLEREVLGVCRLAWALEVREAAGIQSLFGIVLDGRPLFLALLLRADARLETYNYR